MNEDLKQAVEHAKRQGASYADVRAHWSKVRHVTLTDTQTEQREGVAVRVNAVGGWGCAGQSLRDGANLAQACDLALRQAKVGSLLADQGGLSPLKATPTAQQWSHPVKQKPWDMSAHIQRESLKFIAERVRDLDPSLRVDAQLWVWSCGTSLCSSEGHDVTQDWTGCGVGFAVSAQEDGAALKRRYGPLLVLGGWEALNDPNPFTEGWDVAQELLTLFAAPKPLTAGTRDVVFGPRAMATLVHELLGHGLEADLVREGRGLVSLEGWEGAKVGQPWLRVEADATTPGGLGTWAFDDEGEPAGKWLLVEAGAVVGLMSDRRQAALIPGVLTGCARALDPFGMPGVRMPNVHLAPGETPLRTLLRAAHGGLYVDGVLGCEVDHGRAEVRVYAEIGRQIDGEYLTHGWPSPVVSLPLKGFWERCEGLANQESAQMVSLPGCSKKGGLWPWTGTSHRVVPGLFRGASVWPG